MKNSLSAGNSPTRRSPPAKMDRANQTRHPAQFGSSKRKLRQCREFLFSPTLRQRVKPHLRGLIVALIELAGRKHDANRLLHALKYTRRDLRLMPFRRAIDDPNFGARATQIVAHLLESGAVEEAGHRNEATMPSSSLSARRSPRASRSQKLSRSPSAKNRHRDSSGACACAPTPHSGGGFQRSSGATRPLPPSLSIQPPRPPPSPCTADCR